MRQSDRKDRGILIWAWTCTILVGIFLVGGLAAMFTNTNERDARGDRIEKLVEQSAEQLTILRNATSPEAQKRAAESTAQAIAQLNEYNRLLHCQTMAEARRVAEALGIQPLATPTECSR